MTSKVVDAVANHPVADLATGIEVSCSMEAREDIRPGECVAFSKRVTDASVHAFATVTGDMNPLHLDDGVAAATRFGDRIAHGALASGLISAALARIPGLVIYLSCEQEFREPMAIGDVYTAVAVVKEDLGGNRYRVRTKVLDGDDTLVVDGEAVIMVDERPVVGSG